MEEDKGTGTRECKGRERHERPGDNGSSKRAGSEREKQAAEFLASSVHRGFRQINDIYELRTNLLVV